MLMTVSLTASRAPADMPSRMAWEPRFDVMMRMVFLKDTVRPWLSVTLPSSSICTAQITCHWMRTFTEIYVYLSSTLLTEPTQVEL